MPRRRRTLLCGVAALTTCGLAWTGNAGATSTIQSGVSLAPENLHSLVVALEIPEMPTHEAQEYLPPEAPPEPPPPPPPPPPPVTLEDLVASAPGVPVEQLAQYVEPIGAAMNKAGIDTPVRKAAFLSQIVVESDTFRTFEEYASGRAYEGRADLGNVAPGDGERYKGRGAIQVTGRHNYESVSQALGVDFVNNPELMEQPQYAFDTAVWYWQSRDLNTVADTAGIEQVSRVVNGGTNGLPHRIDVFHRAVTALVDDILPPAP